MTGSPDSPATADALWLLRELAAARVLDAASGDAVLQDFRRAGADGDAASLAEFLVQGGFVTAYQADMALAGKADALLLGRYLLAEPVGSGSLGTVFRALHTDTHQRFAVKLLPLRSLWNALQAKRQVVALAALANQPGLVPLADIDTAKGWHYLVWPFVEGEPLDALVRRRGPLPPSQAVRLTLEVCEALAACHAAGIAHGLLKPSNLLLGPDRKARVLDLGIGAILRENTVEGESFMDTISTANVAMSMIDCTPPETLADPGERTPAGDIYSLGCVLYFLLTGVYPFPDGNVVDKMIAHQSEEPLPASARNPAVPEGLSNVVEHLMRKAPADRPADLSLVAAALRESVPDAVDAAPGELPPPSVRRGVPGQSSASYSAGPAAAPFLPDDGETINFDMAQQAETPRDSGVVRLPVAPSRPPKHVPEWSPDSGFGAGPQHSQPVRQIVLQSRISSPTPPPPAPARAHPGETSLPPASVHWASLSGESTGSLAPAPVVVPPQPKFTRSLWGRLASLLPWSPPLDVVQFSLFGPARLAPGQSYRFHVYSHPPDNFASVCTISRAFTSDADLVASGFAAKPIPRGAEVGLHLAVANAGVARSLMSFRWAGQSKPWKFDIHVPWESPSGLVGGVLSIGLDQVQAGRVPFELLVLPRTA
jgi:serine/threonine protein kinase